MNKEWKNMLIVLGIFLAIAVFIYVSSDNNQDKQITGNVIEEEVEELDSTPPPLPTHLASNTQNGVTLSIDGYSFEQKGDNWGKIKDISVTIENKRGATIFFSLILGVYDKNTNMQYIPTKEIKLSEGLYDGQSMSKTISVDFPTSSIDMNKTLKLQVKETYSKIIVTTYLENVDLVQNPII